MFIKDRSAACFFIGIPIVYVLLFGTLYLKNTVNYTATVVYDEDQTALSREVVRAFEDSDRFRIVAYVDTQEELEQYMREKKSLVGVAIPLHFSRDIKKGVSAPILFEVDGSNIIIANTLIGSAQDLIGKVYPAIAQDLIGVIGMSPGASSHYASPIDVETRILNNPTFGYTNFLLIGLGVYALQTGIVLTVGPLVNREFQRLDAWKETATPLILAGKMLAYWLCGVLTFIGYVLICVYVFTLPFRGGIGELLLLGSGYVFSVAAVGCFIGTVAPGEVMAVLMPLLYIMPALLFSGYIWPQMIMNTFSYVFAKSVPIGYMADNMRDLMLNGYAPHLLHDAGILYMSGLVLLVAAGGIFSLRRKHSKFRSDEGAPT
ncbi:MAG: ABC transporter permease [Veillonellales bacterium]